MRSLSTCWLNFGWRGEQGLICLHNKLFETAFLGRLLVLHLLKWRDIFKKFLHSCYVSENCQEGTEQWHIFAFPHPSGEGWRVCSVKSFSGFYNVGYYHSYNSNNNWTCKLSTSVGQTFIDAFHKRFSLNLGETITPSKLQTKWKAWLLREHLSPCPGPDVQPLV